MIAGEVGGAGAIESFAHVKDEIVLAEPFFIRLDHRAGDALQPLANDRLDARGEVDVPDPAAGEVDEILPVARKRKLIDDAGHAVVVVLDLSFQLFSRLKNERFERRDDGRPLVAHIRRRRVLHARLLHGARVDGLLQPIQQNLFADVKLNQHEHGAAQRWLGPEIGRSRHDTPDASQGMVADSGEFRCHAVSLPLEINATGSGLRASYAYMSRTLLPGKPYPLGATPRKLGTNFALFSEGATRVDVCFFDDDGNQSDCVTLRERTAFVWHGLVRDIKPGQLYGFRVDGPWDPQHGHRFNYNKLLVDPYAKAISGQVDWKAPI